MATFGYTSKGATANTTEVRGNSYLAPGDGTITDVSIYIYNNTGSSKNVSVGIFLPDANHAPDTYLSGGSNLAVADAFDGWKTGSGFSESVTNGTEYNLVAQKNATTNLSYYFDSSSPGIDYYTGKGASWTYSKWENNSNYFVSSPGAIRFSIYATYTPGGGGATRRIFNIS